MQFYISFLLIFILVLLSAFQVLYVILYWIFMKQGESNAEQNNQIENNSGALIAETDAANKYQPPVAVVLCLRGADPSLEDCLEGISQLEYPDYQLHVVVDQWDDPAVAILDEYFEEESAERQPRIHVIENRLSTCSLKCSAILEALNHLSAETEIVAFIDADAIPDPRWLDDLVAPFADQSVGATTGNRWFSPAFIDIGTTVRHIWNAAAIVQMGIYNIAWGGTLALRMTAIDQCDLRQKWSNAFCEDTMLTSVLKKQKLKLVRIPDLVMENSEAISLESARNWIVRQLITVRLYHPKWSLVMLHGFAVGFANYVVPIVVLALILMNMRFAAGLVTMGLIGYHVANILCLAVINYANSRALVSRDEFINQRAQIDNIPKYFFAAVLTQLIHPWACFKSHFANGTSWRGVDYKLNPPKVELIKYVPFTQVNTGQDTKDSAVPISID